MVADMLSKASWNSEFGVQSLLQRPPLINSVVLDDLCDIEIEIAPIIGD